MPKSYLSDEPAAQRAKNANFDPHLQVVRRINQLKRTGHLTDKLELIIIGGTFSSYQDDYREEFVLQIFNAINGVKSPNLETAHKINETAKRRVVGLSIETRPDWITPKEVRFLRKLGVTRIQVGVQSFDPKVLKLIKRDHGIRAIATATRLLKDAGFKICYHLMPNLPGSTPKLDIDMAKIMYQDKRFKPDTVKIYPCQVIPHTQLHRQFLEGKFKTYPDDVMFKVLEKIKLLTPPWARIDRLVRDISKGWVESGTIKTNMRQMIKDKLKKEGKSCKCIRCREIKQREFTANPHLKVTNISSVGGKELFLEYEHQGKLYSLLRLRLPNKNTSKPLFAALKEAAIIRELHTFGMVTALKTQEKSKTQHQGLGKKLIKKAEQIAIKNRYKKIAVISSIGTREYYKKLGYKLQDSYMIKFL